MADLKEALKGNDADCDHRPRPTRWRKPAMKLGEAMYKQAAEQPPGGPGRRGQEG